MSDCIKKIRVLDILSQTFLFSKEKPKMFCAFSFINFVFLALFMHIDGGLSNKISIVWVFAYYAYWCAFFRVYYNKKPYLLTADVFGSLIPSTKIIFLVAALVLFLANVLPYIPLLMGFDDKYLLLFETYMQELQKASVNSLNMIVLSSMLVLLFPFILCRPFLAFIASVQGLNGSLRKAWKKSAGNYWQFIAIMFLFNLPCVLIYEADNYLNCNGYLTLVFYSVGFVYYNVIFAKLYDFFYTD